MKKEPLFDIDKMNWTKNSIDHLVTRFETQSLPKPEWTHGAHIVMAFHFLGKYPWPECLGFIRSGIIAHNESVGTPNTDDEGYHETITLFWMHTIRHFIEDRQAEEVDALVNAFLETEKASPSYPLEFYTRDHLFSTKARRIWVEPDLKKLSE